VRLSPKFYGLETVRLRYFNIFRPASTARQSVCSGHSLFFEAMLAGQSPVIYGDGEQSRDFTYVADAFRQPSSRHRPKASSKVYNRRLRSRTSLLDLVAKINALLGTNSNRSTKSSPRRCEAQPS